MDARLLKFLMLVLFQVTINMNNGLATTMLI